MMKIEIASDLHLEMLEHRFPGQRLVEPAPEADLLVLAGDIHSDLQGIKAFSDWPVPVLYVMGNHEFYGQHYENLRYQVRKLMASDKQSGSVLVLENEAADFSRFPDWCQAHAEELRHFRFLGCTLWTDYRHPGSNRSQLQQMAEASKSLYDFEVISSDEGRFTVHQVLQEHLQSRRWLERELAKPFDGKTVVITHHGPHRLSTHARYEGDDLNGAFVSHLPELVEQADLWIHGHTHDSFEYRVGRCEVVTNPRGYARDLRRGLEEAEWENEHFAPIYVIEL